MQEKIVSRLDFFQIDLCGFYRNIEIIQSSGEPGLLKLTILPFLFR